MSGFDLGQLGLEGTRNHEVKNLKASYYKLFRSLENQRKKYKIGKLFAKHIKLKEQIEFLKGNSVPIAVGTPSRVLKLLEETDLLNQVSCLVIDSAKDLKERTVVSMKETCDPLLDVVFKLRGRLVNRKCHISLVE